MDNDFSIGLGKMSHSEESFPVDYSRKRNSVILAIAALMVIVDLIYLLFERYSWITSILLFLLVLSFVVQGYYIFKEKRTRSKKTKLIEDNTLDNGFLVSEVERQTGGKIIQNSDNVLDSLFVLSVDGKNYMCKIYHDLTHDDEIVLKMHKKLMKSHSNNE